MNVCGLALTLNAVGLENKIDNTWEWLYVKILFNSPLMMKIMI